MTVPTYMWRAVLLGSWLPFLFLANGCATGDIANEPTMLPTDNQEQLVVLATESADPLIRQRATKYLNNQKLLGQIARLDPNTRVKIAAVNNLTNQEELEDILRVGYGQEVGLAAIKRIRNQELLAHIAKSWLDPTLELAAIREMTDQRLLSRIALLDRDVKKQKLAYANVSDQSLFRKVAAEAIRKTTLTPNNPLFVSRFVPLDLIEELAYDDEYKHARLLMANHIENEDIFKYWFERDDRKKHKIAALKRITDQRYLARVGLGQVLRWSDIVLDNSMLQKITDQSIVESLAADSPDANTRCHMIFGIENSDVLRDLIREKKNVYRDLAQVAWLIKDIAIQTESNPLTMQCNLRTAKQRYGHYTPSLQTIDVQQVFGALTLLNGNDEIFSQSARVFNNNNMPHRETEKLRWKRPLDVDASRFVTAILLAHKPKEQLLERYFYSEFDVVRFGALALKN